ARCRIERGPCVARAAQRGLADSEQARELGVREAGPRLDLLDGIEREPGEDPLVPPADLTDLAAAAEQLRQPPCVNALPPAHLIGMIRSLERSRKRGGTFSGGARGRGTPESSAARRRPPTRTRARSDSPPRTR